MKRKKKNENKRQAKLFKFQEAQVMKKIAQLPHTTKFEPEKILNRAINLWNFIFRKLLRRRRY